jgi:hypothetical protein
VHLTSSAGPIQARGHKTELKLILMTFNAATTGRAGSPREALFALAVFTRFIARERYGFE